MKHIYFLIALVLVVILLYGLRLILQSIMFKVAVKTKLNGIETPVDAGLDYENITLISGSHQLQAWWVKAPTANDLY